MGEIVAVCSSEKKGERKREYRSVVYLLILDWKEMPMGDHGIDK